jgi:hypothetical protein
MINFDYGPAPQAVNGYILAMTKQVSTPSYIGAVNTYVHSLLAERFNQYLDMIAKVNPDTLHHVYEWPSRYQGKETIGNPVARLWSQQLKGNGASKTASFRFKASIRPSPVNPILTTPGKNGKSVKTGVHVFVWKAPVMEAGTEITVTAKLAKYLAFVADKEGQSGGSTSRVNNSEIAFAKSTTFTAGGGKTTGAFTGQWVGWWQTMAGAIYDKEIAPRLEKDLNMERELGRLGRRWGNKTTKTFSIGINNAALVDGETQAMVEMKRLSAGYINQAAARRRLIYGD